MKPSLRWALMLALALGLGAPARGSDRRGSPPPLIVLPGAATPATGRLILLDKHGRPLAETPQMAPLALPLPAMPLSAIDLSREGQPVVPYLLSEASARREDLDLDSHRKNLAQSVLMATPALAESVELGNWNGPGTTLENTCCGDAAPKLALLLRHIGLPIDVIEAELHYYALWKLAEGQLFADPTIRQFFGGARAPPAIPRVFVGTQSQLQALFTRHAAAKTTKFDVERIYMRQAAVRNERMAELQRQPTRPDLVPLSRYINSRRN